jgi:hypothetical protein
MAVVTIARGDVTASRSPGRGARCSGPQPPAGGGDGAHVAPRKYRTAWLSLWAWRPNWSPSTCGVGAVSTIFDRGPS